MKKGSRRPWMAEELRFFAKITTDSFSADRCWTWSAHLNADGYGAFAIGGRYGRQEKAHRFAYVLFSGEIPVGCEIDHTCGNRACVNPSHLDAVSHKENVRRGNHPNQVARRNLRCKRGHDRSDAYSNGGSCRVCKLQLSKVAYVAKKTRLLAERLGILQPQPAAEETEAVL